MATRLAQIFGTEEDKVNCPFYYKTGACRHGDRCTKHHTKPAQSQTILIPHMYENPPAAIAFSEGTKVPEEALKEAIRHFEDFYEEVFTELTKYGELEGLYVCDNVGDHLMGNVYAKFYSDVDAGKALAALNGRYYAGRILQVEFSPVTYFKLARCRQYDENACDRGGYCNYMHLKHVSRSFKRSLFRQMYDEYPEYRKRRAERMREEFKKYSKSRSRSRSHSRSRSRSGSRHGHHHHRHHYHSKPKDSNNREKSKSKSRSHSRSRSKEHERNFFRKDSKERRAMVAQWAEEDAKIKQQAEAAAQEMLDKAKAELAAQENKKEENKEITKNE